MSRINISWDWTLEDESPLHTGSGISRAGFADRLIQRDAAGNPVILGDAVKGALRLSAEQIYAWFGNPQEEVYAHRGNAEPTDHLLAALFGENACARFEAAVLKSPASEMKLPGTAIDRTTGRAKNDTLRIVEVLPPGSVFMGKCTLWPPDGDEPILRTLLLAALAATESVGGKAGIGWGRLRVSNVKGNDADLVLGDLSAIEAAIRAKQRIPDKGIPDAQPIVAEKTSATPQWYRLEITLEEPLCIGAAPDVTNRQATLDYIPAPALRGALRAAWLGAGRSESEVAARIGESTRWTNAHPAIETDRGLEPCVPIPRSYACDKKEPGFQSIHGIHDAASGAKSEIDGERIQWQAMKDGWMHAAPAGTPGGEPRLTPYGRDGLLESRMHVARNYRTGSKREGALFSRDAITAKDESGKARCYIAYVKAPVAADEWPAEIHVGKRTSVGYGRANLAAAREPKEKPWPSDWTQAPRHENVVLIQLLSDALLPSLPHPPQQAATGPKEQPGGDRFLGAYHRSMPPDLWRELLGDRSVLAPKAVVARTAVRSQRQWMSTWRHSRSPITTLAAGSVWRLEFANDAETDHFRKAAIAAGGDGIGHRRHEGFGQFVVDPPWLGHRYLARGQGAEEKVEQRSSRRPQGWPGCESLDRSLLLSFLERVKSLKLSATVRGPLQELATRAREADTESNCTAVMEFCERMANRRTQKESTEQRKSPKGKNAYAWLDLRDPRRDQDPHLSKEKKEELYAKSLRRVLDDAAKVKNDAPDLLRFVIDALLIQCPKP